MSEEKKKPNETFLKDVMAKKDFIINWPGEKKEEDFYLVIKKGDNLAKVPQKFLQNLKTEGVL